MLETDIAKKCTATLIGVALLVCVSVWVSRWTFSSGGATRAPQNPTERASVVVPQTEKSVESSSPRFGPLVSKTSTISTERTLAQDQLERKAFQLELENARLRGRLEDMLNWILENVRGTFPLPEGQMANLRLIPVDEDMAVSDDLTQVLRLNEEEVDRLDSAFMGTRSVLQDLEKENISVDAPTENQVVLNIPPYAEEGQIVREELYGDLKKTLGSARFDRFLEVAEAGLDEKFEYFGEADRTLQFEAVKDEQSGVLQLFVRDERVVPSKDDPLRQNITASERIVTELPAEYYPYWNWLPEYVTRFSKGN